MITSANMLKYRLRYVWEDGHETVGDSGYDTLATAEWWAVMSLGAPRLESVHIESAAKWHTDAIVTKQGGIA